MTIVTFTTDYGTRDYYAGSLKGAVLSGSASLQLVDITHNIKSFDIVQAAFILKNAFSQFPAGTIHVLSVQNHQERGNWLLGMSRDGHHFIGPDNGLFTLMFGAEITVVRLLYNLTIDHGFAKTISESIEKLAAGKEMAAIGEGTKDYVQRIHFKPIVTQDQIRASVIHIDQFGNAIFNITRDQFEQHAQHREFELYYKRHDPLKVIHAKYTDVAIGEVLCIFNDAGYLELAVNTGRAEGLLGLKVDDTIQIRFINGEI